MFKFTLIALTGFCLLNSSLTAYVYTDNATGDQITLWENWGSSGFEIRASMEIGGVYNSSVNIADPLTDPLEPKGSVNNVGQAAAIWRGNDPTLGSKTLYGATYSGGVWSTPVSLSDPSQEQVQSEFYVTVASSGVMVVTWRSYLFPSGPFVMRSIYCPTFGTWTTPITIM